MEKAAGVEVPQMTFMRLDLTQAGAAPEGAARSNGRDGSETFSRQSPTSGLQGLSAVVQQGNPTSTPFAFILAGYGDIWALRDLAGLLGSHQTVYALYPPQQTELAAGSIRELAVRYAGELRKLQPAGPYLLGGYSAGGLVGIEVARLLRRDGHAVPYLALFDPAAIHCTTFYDRSLRPYFSRSVLALAPLMKHCRIRSFEILRAFVTDKGLDRHFHVLRGYKPEPYSGEMTLFRASLSRCLPSCRIGGFKQMARGGLRIHVTPGNHHTFIRHPHVAEVAVRLSADLRAFSGQSAAGRGR